MAILVKANTATASYRRVFFQLVDATDGKTAETGEAGGQPQISTDGGAFTDTGIGTLTHCGNGRYYADVTQAAIATAGSRIETRYKSANTCESPGDTLQVVAFDPYDANLGLTNLDAAVSTRAPSATALSTADWTNTRAGYLDNLDAAVSTRAPGATALSTAQWTNTRAGLLDNLDAAMTSRASAATALDNSIWTTLRAAKLDNLDATIASRAAASTALSTAQWTNTRAGLLDNLDAAITTRASASALSTLQTTCTSISTVVSTTGVAVADKDGYALAADGVDLVVVETGVNLRQACSAIAAMSAGAASGAGTGTMVYKAANNSGTTRITAVCDAGNRTSVTLSLPA